MGLDNGIMIKRATVTPKAAAAFDEEWRDSNGYDLEVAYWRKCWNVRTIILMTLNIWSDNDYECSMTIDDIVKVINALKKINKKNYVDCGSCIWDWSEFKSIQRRNLRNLRRLVRIMRRDKGLHVYFYDSY